MITLETEKGNREAERHLVPAFEWVLPPLHQVALTDPRDAEIHSGAGRGDHVHMLQVVHYLPVARLAQRKQRDLTMKLQTSSSLS